jgi:hypothetical protein
MLEIAQLHGPFERPSRMIHLKYCPNTHLMTEIASTFEAFG